MSVRLAPTRLLQRLDEVDFGFLLGSDGTPWQTLHVTYAEPHVERLWIPYRDGRLFLHRIHPCVESNPLWHPHPWPSASRVVRGSYIHRIGDANGPKQVTRLSAGSSWDISDPGIWHSVDPLEPVLTVMVTGRLFDEPETFERPTVRQSALTPSQRRQLLSDFREVAL